MNKPGTEGLTRLDEARVFSVPNSLFIITCMVLCRVDGEGGGLGPGIWVLGEVIGHIPKKLLP